MVEWFMIILIAGGTHTGKTWAAQRFLEKYRYPYLSMDHLKMGLIRSGVCPLSPESDSGELTSYLWNIVKEMIKTALENRQNLIVEGCYIPFDWKKDFDGDSLRKIRYICLIFSEKYIRSHYGDILKHANIIESRPDGGGCSKEMLLEENRRHLRMCREHGCPCLLMDDRYEVEWDVMQGRLCNAGMRMAAGRKRVQK